MFIKSITVETFAFQPIVIDYDHIKQKSTKIVDQKRYQINCFHKTIFYYGCGNMNGNLWLKG